MPSTLTLLLRASVWLTLGGAGCSAIRSAYPVVPSEIAQAIPQNARAVKVYSDQPPADYYRTVYRALVGRGFDVHWWNKDQKRGTLSTEFKDFNPLTALKLNVVVEDAPGGSVATLRGQERDSDDHNRNKNIAYEAAGMGELSSDHGRAEDAIWKEHSGAAFGEMAVIANALPHTRVEYVSR